MDYNNTLIWFDDGLMVGYYGFLPYYGGANRDYSFTNRYDDFVLNILQDHGMRDIMANISVMEMKESEFKNDVIDFINHIRGEETDEETVLQNAIIEEYQAIMDETSIKNKHKAFKETLKWLKNLDTIDIIDYYGWHEFFTLIAI